jgi:hypothetical protein
VVCYAESKDGIEWNRPALNLFSYNGIRDTNIVLIGNGGHSFNYGASVVVTPHDRISPGAIKWRTSIGQNRMAGNIRG